MDVTYSATGVPHILHLDHDLVICGPIVQTLCGQAPGSPGSQSA